MTGSRAYRRWHIIIARRARRSPISYTSRFVGHAIKYFRQTCYVIICEHDMLAPAIAFIGNFSSRRLPPVRLLR